MGSLLGHKPHGGRQKVAGATAPAKRLGSGRRKRGSGGVLAVRDVLCAMKENLPQVGRPGCIDWTQPEHINLQQWQPTCRGTTLTGRF